MKFNNKLFIFLFFSLIFLDACTPKVVEETTEKEEIIVDKSDKILSSCKKFYDNPNGSDLEDKYIIYKDFLKVKQYEESFEMWKDVYKNAPAADGKRWTVFTDGIFYYEYFLSQGSLDAETRLEYEDMILQLYDDIAKCYPDQTEYAKAGKAFDLYYKYPEKVDDDTKYRLFKEVIDAKQLESYVYVLNPFTKLMVDRFAKGDIDTAEARHYAQLVPAIVQNGLEKGKDLKSWVTVRDYALPYIERLETVKGFFHCDYFKNKYIAKFNNEEKTCEGVTEIYSRLRYGRCVKSDDILVEVYSWLQNNDCIAKPKPTDPCAGVVSTAYGELRDGNYQKAIQKLEEAISCSSSDKNMGTYNMLISKIYYAHIKNFPKSRSYAQKAIQHRPAWGDPYILIGKLYASSGPLCGPGRGFDSQIVTWPAIDMWNRAKSVDASIIAEADELIRKYRQYMPSKEDIFQRGLQEGQTYRVKCWIQENTTIRTL